MSFRLRTSMSESERIYQTERQVAANYPNHAAISSFEGTLGIYTAKRPSISNMKVLKQFKTYVMIAPWNHYSNMKRTSSEPRHSQFYGFSSILGESTQFPCIPAFKTTGRRTTAIGFVKSFVSRITNSVDG